MKPVIEVPQKLTGLIRVRWMELKKLISQFVLVITACLLVAPKWLSADDEPFLRIEAGGPQSYVTALAFDPTGTTIYAAGWDKVVRVWHRDPANGKWVIDENSTLRLPIGPGLFGSINAMTVSDDGRWLAVGGHGIFRAGASFRQPGRVVPSEGFLTTEMRRDEGLIYVFDIRETRVHLLRGHAGSIVSLAFAPGDETPVLVSAAREWQDKQNGSGRFVGLLKVWDVLHPKDQDSSIASLELPDPKTRPGLAIRRTGSGLTQFEVAIGWGDEHFRIWNVTKKTVEDVACEKNGNTVALSADASGFITGVVGQLEFRKPGRPPEAISLRVGNEFVYPRALARGGSQSGQVVAVASRVLDPSGRPRSPDRFVLQVARSNDRKIGAPSGPCLLWEVSATGALPTVALSPDGEVAALAGGADHSIWIYRTQDIRPGGNPVQILKNSGRNWRQVSFVNKDQHRGMALKSASGELVFDLVEQAAVKDTKGWKSNSASAGDWRIDPRREGEVSVVVISRGNREVSRAILPEGESVSAHAFLPNVEPNANRPTMVAIASQLIGQASLRLFNAETGETFRELTGHTEVIRSLSFEAGGRLLASVAGDQVVCVWDLADIDAILGERGMLPGVAVRGGDGDRQGEISIATIRETAPASIRGKFFAKDVLQGVTIDGKQQSWSTPREFSDVLWSIKPGTQANFSVNRQGRMTEVLTAVGQGIDERKPMLSFFFPNAEDQRTDWIAWTPLGPYEASDRSVERFLGWHFNIGDAIQVTKFAPASDYRKTYYRDGLVKELIEKGNLPKRQVPRPTAVNIRFGPEAQQELTSGETVHIRQKPRTFHLYLGDLPSQFVASIEMEMDGQTFRDFSQSVENEWVSELTDLEWKRSVKQCRCTVHTNEVPAQQFTFNATVQFTPLPPVLQSTTPTDQVVKEAAFRYAADVKSPSSQKTDLRVLLNGRPLDPATVNEEGARIERDLELQPGDNVIEVLARNEGARPETHEIETTRSVTRVTYQKAKALPPKIVVDRFEVFDKKTGNWSPVSQDEQEKSLIVTQPKFRVHGTIRAAESPSSAHWSHEKPGAAAARQPLALEKNGDAKVWQFTQACDLNPGGQQLNFYARSADSDEASWPLRVEFRGRERIG
jgi:WD40 repeat protein